MSDIKRFKPGLWVALVTPMNGGEIDYEKLKGLVEWHVEQGTDGLVPCGTTGESATFSHDEHKRVVEAVIEAAAGRIQIMAGTGSNSTREAVELTKHAQQAGADGALVITPYYNKPTQAGLIAHFGKVIEATPDFPLCLYNVPGRTACDMQPETVGTLAQSSPSVVAVKEASGLVDRVSEIQLAAPGVDVFSGDDSLTLPMLSVGAAGVISVAGNIVPKLCKAMLAAFANKDTAAARDAHLRLYPLFKGLFIETNPIPIKAAMAMTGQLPEDYRLPLVAPSEATREQLRGILKGLEVL